MHIRMQQQGFVRSAGPEQVLQQKYSFSILVVINTVYFQGTKAPQSKSTKVTKPYLSEH
jgi:hypothetical protein